MGEIGHDFAPLSRWDEHPIHQSVAPVRFVATTDPRAFERYWFTAAPSDGRFLFVLGMGFYPNAAVADAYALLVHDGVQTTVRAQRRIVGDPAEMLVGPILAEPVAAFGEWHLRVADNDRKLRCDLRWRDTKRAHFRKMDLSRLPGVPANIHLQHSWGGYETFGRVDGWIDIDGARIELDPAHISGSRDHHWGVRDGVGGLTIAARNSGFSHCGQFVEFADWALWADQVLYPIGSSRKHPAFAEAVDFKLGFYPDTHHFREAIVTNRLSNGETRVLHFKHIAGATAFLRAAGYSGPDGRGTPDGNHHHGQDLGGAVSGHSQDLSAPHMRQAIEGFEDQLCTVECDGETTTGIFECCNPFLYKMCEAGLPGYSFLSGA